MIADRRPKESHMSKLGKSEAIGISQILLVKSDAN